MRVTFTRDGWEDYSSWVGQQKVLRRISGLIKEAARDRGAGTGKPERLGGDLSGFWSRRMDQEHRLVYTVSGDDLVVVAARYHY